MNKVPIILKRILSILIFISSFLFLSFSLKRNVSAAPFNISVNDTIPGSSRWSTTNSGCTGQRGIVLSCISNCSNSSMRWDCNDGLGGHLNIWDANTGSDITVRLTPPTSPSFPTAYWHVVDRRDSNYHPGGNGWEATFHMTGNQDYRYLVYFVMQPPPTPTPMPELTATNTPTPAPTTPPPPPAADCPHAEGCFDCQWVSIGTIGGRGVCGVVNIECANSYIHDAEHCYELTSEGQTTCNSSENQNIACIRVPDESDFGTSTGDAGEPEYFCGSGNSAIETAIGCISYMNIGEFTAFMLRWFIGLGGGVGFILMVYGGFLVITSGGNPEKLNLGKTILISSVSGLLFMIFSVFILRVVGVDILQIPNF